MLSSKAISVDRPLAGPPPAPWTDWPGAAISAVAEAAPTAASVEELLGLVAERFAMLTGLAQAGAAIADEEGLAVSISVGQGIGDLAPDALIGLLRRALKGDGAFYCNDCHADPTFGLLVEADPSIASLIAVIVPIGRGRVAAAWGVAPTGGAFDEGDAAAVELFGRQAFVWVANRQLEDEVEWARQRLRSLHGTVKNIAESSELEEILPQIVNDATNLLGATSGDMLLLDEERSVLMVVGICNLTEEMLNFEMPFGEGVSSRAMQYRKPIPVSDYPNYPHRARHVDAEAFKAVLSVPLVSRGKAIGAINVHRDEVGYRFDQDEIDLLVAFADHAAVAIDTAQRYENERALSSHLKDLNAAMKRRNAELARAMEVQNRLAQSVLTDQGLDAIVAELADLVGHPVEVHDRLLHLLASAPSSAEPGRLTALAAQDEFQMFLDELAERRAAITSPTDDGCLMAPLLAGNEVLGYVTVLGAADLEGIDLALINLAITALSLELMKIRTAVEAEQRVRGDLVIDLIEGTLESPDLMRARASYLGYSLDEPYDLALLATTADGDQPDDRLRRRIRDFVERYLSQRSSQNIVAEIAQGVVVFLDAASDTTPPLETLGSIRSAIVEQFGKVGVVAVLSERCSAPEDFRGSFRLARETVDVLQKLEAPADVVDAREQRLFRLLLKASSRDELVAYSDELLEPIRAHDRDRGAALEETLRLYLDNGGNQRRAAAAGYLHPNTVAYRLRRLEQVLGRDLSVPENVLELQLALRVSDLLRPRGT